MPAEQERLEVEAREYLRHIPQDEQGPLEHGDVLLARALAELQAAQEQMRVLREAAADIIMASHQVVFDKRSRFGVSLRNLRELLAAQRTDL